MLLHENLRGLPLRERPYSFRLSTSLDPGALQTQVCIHPLKLRVLSLQILQPLEFGDTHPAVLRAQVEVGRPTDPVLADQITDGHTRLAFLQDLRDLRFAKPLFPHRLSSSAESLLFARVNAGGAYAAALVIMSDAFHVPQSQKQHRLSALRCFDRHPSDSVDGADFTINVCRSGSGNLLSHILQKTP